MTLDAASWQIANQAALLAALQRVHESIRHPAGADTTPKQAEGSPLAAALAEPPLSPPSAIDRALPTPSA